MNTPKKVEIQWIDSKGIKSSWEYQDDLNSLEPVLVTSLSYLFEDKEEYKTIAQSASADQVLGRMTIPVVSIKKVCKIK